MEPSDDYDERVQPRLEGHAYQDIVSAFIALTRRFRKSIFFCGIMSGIRLYGAVGGVRRRRSSGHLRRREYRGLIDRRGIRPRDWKRRSVDATGIRVDGRVRAARWIHHRHECRRRPGADFIPAEYFTLGASIGVLLFIGLGILIGNVLNVSTSTSQTAVAAVVAMGAALGVLDWRTVGVVGMWWVLSTTLAFWICAFVGRYFYDAIVNLLSFESDDTGRFAELVVIGIGCYMGFSTGASNVASAVAPSLVPGSSR